MRYFTWHVDSLRVGTSQQETYRLDGDYNPVRAWVHVEGSPTGAELMVDINVDGVSIFAYRPRLQDGTDTDETVFSTAQMNKDSLISMDIDQIGSKEPGRAMTVGLELEEA